VQAPVQPPAPARRSRWPYAIAALVVIGGGIAIAVVATRGGGSDDAVLDEARKIKDKVCECHDRDCADDARREAERLLELQDHDGLSKHARDEVEEMALDAARCQHDAF
jgi:hypothetical protein